MTKRSTKLKECVECGEVFEVTLHEARKEYTCVLCTAIWIEQHIKEQLEDQKNKISLLQEKEEERKERIKAKIAAELKEQEYQTTLVREKELAREVKRRGHQEKALARKEERKTWRVRKALAKEMQPTKKQKREELILQNMQLSGSISEVMTAFGLNRKDNLIWFKTYNCAKYLGDLLSTDPEKEHENLIWVCSVLKTYTK